MTDHACSSCDAPIVWAMTPAEKRMPVDPAPHPDGNVRLHDNALDDMPTTSTGLGVWMSTATTAVVVGPLEVELARDVEPLYRSHFATCPDADLWRKCR